MCSVLDGTEFYKINQGRKIRVNLQFQVGSLWKDLKRMLQIWNIDSCQLENDKDVDEILIP